jgi:cold shock CspA family protein
VSANQLIKIGVFYDGSYFGIVSNYYMHHHPKNARISISGLHKFVRHKVAREEGIDVRYCQVIDAHYFRGRFSAQQSAEKGGDTLYRERVWDDILMKENVTTHYLPMNAVGEEKGIDVWLALEAFELSIYKQFNVVVLVAGDSDYIPLVRKLNTLGIRVMALGWSVAYDDEGGQGGTRASQMLLSEASNPVLMADVIDGMDALEGEEKEALSDLFVRRRAHDVAHAGGEAVAQPAGEVDGWKVGSIVNLGQGFGFIKPGDGGENLFFHHSAITNADFDVLFKGMEVSYQEGTGQKGPAATKVRADY